MANIRIPEAVLPGFFELSKLSKEQIGKFVSYLKDIPVGTKLSSINDFLYTKLNITSSKNIVETLISFSELLEPSDVNFETLTDDLLTAFKSLNEDPELTENNLSDLKTNLLEIFKNSNNLKLTLKAFKLSTEDDFLFVESRIITDIRLVFNDDISESKRNALIIHKLHIGFKENKEFCEMFFSFNAEDLKQLKTDIERAIHKEELIRKDYSATINFIDINA